jgi:hypothetical protein
MTVAASDTSHGSTATSNEDVVVSIALDVLHRKGLARGRPRPVLSRSSSAKLRLGSRAVSQPGADAGQDGEGVALGPS